MSILNNENNNQPSPAEVAAQKLIQITKHTYQQMINSFNQGAEIFWNNSMGASSIEIADKLGTNAKEIFELHYKLGQLLSSVDNNTIVDASNLIGTFTMNNDGTVTVIESELENQ
jgi:hypothetical protein